MNSRLMRSQVLLFIAGVLASAPAPAATYIWTGGGADGNWTTTANWNPSSGYPGVLAGDVVRLTTDADIVLDTSVAFSHIYVGAFTTSPKNVVAITGDAANPPVLSISSLFNLGINDPYPGGYQPRGELHLDDVALKIGSASAPATFYVGAEYSSRKHLPRGILKQTGGSFEGYLGDTRIGYCGSVNTGTSTNLVDLSAVTGGKLRIAGATYIAYGQTRTLAEVLLGEDWDVALGTDEAPITLSLAHSTSTQNDKYVRWHQAAGLFRGRFSSVNLGYAAINSPSKVASGVMSFGPGTSVDISDGNLRVACGNDLIITGRLDAAATANGRLEVSSLFQIAQQSNG